MEAPTAKSAAGRIASLQPERVAAAAIAQCAGRQGEARLTPACRRGCHQRRVDAPAVRDLVGGVCLRERDATRGAQSQPLVGVMPRGWVEGAHAGPNGGGRHGDWQWWAPQAAHTRWVDAQLATGKHALNRRRSRCGAAGGLSPLTHKDKCHAEWRQLAPRRHSSRTRRWGW